MNIRLMFPSLYLSVADLKGKDVHLTIRRVVVEELQSDRGKEKKPIVYFEETRRKAEENGDVSKEKRLVLGRPNGLQIGATLDEEETEKWPGRRITLYEGRHKGAPCIRVRPTEPPPSTQAKES